MDVNQDRHQMAPVDVLLVRDKLVDRRDRLERARKDLPQAEQLSQLLVEVDAALARIEGKTYGLCEVCHDPIETDRLAADPLVRYCLDHLSATEARALEHDLDLAGRIQSALLPKPQLSIGGWDASYHYEPLGVASGDYCDLIASDRGELLFLLGDVAGKGIAASVLMAHLHAIFRSLVSLQLAFGELMEGTNRIFCESTGGQHYATIVYGRATASGEVEICNAGHCPPLWIRRDGVTTLPATGLPVGLFSSTPYSTARISMSRGDTLFLYTDGVTESRDPAGAEYGVERLQRTMAREASGSASELVTTCRTDVATFRGGAPRSDDLTILAVRRAS
jgi:sigma-B regulation protein RsbU (phosphoserine phosphatase)